jgi:hypothetical protein
LSERVVPLSNIQVAVLRLLAAHRDPESYVAGATPLNRNTAHYSSDIDVFHDREERVAAGSLARCHRAGDGRLSRRVAVPITPIVAQVRELREIVSWLSIPLRLGAALDIRSVIRYIKRRIQPQVLSALLGGMAVSCKWLFAFAELDVIV